MIGLIRVKIWDVGKMIADSGNIIDDGQDSFKGGRLGVYCDSQALLTWSAINYRLTIILFYTYSFFVLTDVNHPSVQKS